MRRGALLIIGGLFVAAPLVAQEHQHEPSAPDSVAPPAMADMMGMMMTMMAQMHGAMGGGMPGTMGGGMMPGMMDLDCVCLPLRIRGALGLTADQVQRIEAIEQRSGKEQAEHARLAAEAQGEAMAALHAESPDLQQYEARARAAASHQVGAQLARARGWVQAREILTADQRGRLDTAVAAMRELMRPRP